MSEREKNGEQESWFQNQIIQTKKLRPYNQLTVFAFIGQKVLLSASDFIAVIPKIMELHHNSYLS